MMRAALYSLLLMLGTAVTGCVDPASRPTTETEIQHILAPTGSLRVALYTGTPTSVLSQTDLRGVGYQLGKALAQRLKVPFQPNLLASNAAVQQAMQAGRADIAFTNATAERAEYLDFTQPYLLIELGYLTMEKSSVAELADVDRPGVRVGVTANSTSGIVLSHDLKNAKVVATATLATGIKLLSAGDLEVFATNKATLFEMADQLPGSRVLDGSWGVEQHALGIPKGRERGLPYVRAFIADAIDEGMVKAAVVATGLRGAAVADSSR